MISVSEALTRILSTLTPLPAELVGLENAHGRITAAPVIARLSFPPVDISAMDGYAVRAVDVAAPMAVLEQIGEAPAGGHFPGTVGPGQCVRIFTGGPVPMGADTIIIQENVEVEPGSGLITIKEAAQPNRHIRRAGLDFRAGDIGIPAGHTLTARHIGLAAAMNVPWLQAHRRPRVAILSTGNELAMPGDPLGPQDIVSSNGLALMALVRACGGEPVHLGIARDTPDAIAAAISAGLQADLLVTSGGASVGVHDLVQSGLTALGAALDFWKIAMRPGKPMMFATKGRAAVLGLPGNPVSCMVCALLFLRPALRQLQGCVQPVEPRATARLGRALAANDQREDYLRASLSRNDQGELIVMPYATQDSSMLRTLAEADCLAIRPPHAPAAAAGDPIDIISFPGGMAGL